MTCHTALIDASKALATRVDAIDIPAPVTHVYNPLDYAWAPWAAYVRKFARATCRTLFLGINPGPWGMAQTGVPFGEVAAVRHWLKIHETVFKPRNEHPGKPVEGFACKRSEVSGKRLWSLFANRFETADAFFDDHFVLNYCPLLLTNGTDGRATNVLPERLPAEVRETLFNACDEHLRTFVTQLQPEWLIGVGKFAEARLCQLFGNARSFRIGSILHPSPASPLANRGFEAAATQQLLELGVWQATHNEPPIALPE